MISVKVSTNFVHWPLIRQTPRGLGEWGDCRFFVNQEVDECDFWVVLDGLVGPETSRCASRNTLLVTCEPPDVKTYPAEFVCQFGAVLTSHQTIEHSRVIYGQQGLPWMFGAHLEPMSRTWTNFMSFEQIEGYSTNKPLLASLVASKDKWTPGHAARDRFISELIQRLANRIDVFGLGYTPISDKVDAIAPYRYHIAIENSCMRDYWTEKLADAFLGRAFPIYSGCPNLERYFPTRSYEQIDISDPAAAARRVGEIISSDLDLERRTEIEQARKRILYEHNVFAMLDSLVQELHETSKERAAPLTLHPAPVVQPKTVAKGGVARALLARCASLRRGLSIMKRH